MKNRFLPLLALLLTTLLQPALALSVKPPTLSELVERSETIVRGVVTGTRAVEKGEGAQRRIYTLVRIRVEKTLVGVAPEELELEFLGGSLNGRTLTVAGMTRFAKGDKDILFVAGNGRSLCPLVGVNHGRYLIVSRENGAEDFVARCDASPLKDVSEISRPLGEHIQGAIEGATQLRAQAASPTQAAALDSAMTLAAFEATILECAGKLGRSAQSNR